MKWDVRSVFTGAAPHLPIEDKLDFSDFEFQGSNPFKEPISVHGTVDGAGSVVLLRADVSYRMDGVCDRCLTPTVYESSFSIERVLVTSTENDSDDLVVVDQFMLDLDDLVSAEIWMELPTKTLCREDCRGLCPSCGKNLNEGECGCSGKTIDPRLAALADYLS